MYLKKYNLFETKLRLFFLIAVLLCFSGKATGQILPFTHYTPEGEVRALPSAEVHKVYQDQLGYIWFAIYSSGLVRYDGVSMQVYGIESGLSDVTVWDIIEDPTGRLWVSSNAGVMVTDKPLSHYQPGEPIQFATMVQNIPLINVSVNHNRMAVDRNGSLWIGTESLGVIRYRFNEADIFEADTISTQLPTSEGNIAVRSLLARRDGSLWISVLNGNLIRYLDGSPTYYNTGSENNTNALHETKSGELWGGEQNGRVWKLLEHDKNYEFQEINKALNSNIANIYSDSKDNIWISSEGSGLQKLHADQSSWDVYTRSNGLIAEIVFGVMEDFENNLWIAQSGGVSKLRYNYEAFTNFKAESIRGEAPLLPSPSINTVMPVSSRPKSKVPCAFWAGSSEGGIACIDENFNSTFIQQSDGLTGNWVNGIAIDTAGRIWAGTSRGLNSISFEPVKPINQSNSSRRINHLMDIPAQISTFDAASILSVIPLEIPTSGDDVSKLSSIWFPAYHEVYALIQDSLYTFNSDWGLPATIYHAATYDSGGYLWIGTRDRGIYRSREPLTMELLQKTEQLQNKDTFFQQWWSVDDGAPTNQIDVILYSHNKMWVGTTAGLVALDEYTLDVLHTITTDNGLLANNATSITRSPITDTFWIGTNAGLAEIDPRTGKVLKTVTKGDGLVDNEVWFYGSVRADDQGNIYFGTAKGISIYRPYKDFENKYPPVVRLTNFISEDVLGKRNEFSFNFAALSFGNEREVQYQTRLLGFNDEWSKTKSDVKVNYTNLSAFLFPKVYTFEARAVNESGVWSDQVLSYSFSVNPVWWLSWWACLGYLMIFLAGVFVVDRFQRNRLLKKERETALLRETELKAQTAIARSKTAEAQAKALEAENELKATELEKARELEIAYNELKSTQKRLIQAEKMASLGRLSTGIAHEIKNPLNFINNFAEISKELVDELKVAIETNDKSEIELITKNLSFNTQKIEEHGKRADTIVKSMMQHSKGSNHKFGKVDINDLIRKFADLVIHNKQVKSSNSGILLDFNLQPDLPEVIVNQQQVGQVFQNILENAIDAVWELKLKGNGTFKPEINIMTLLVDGRIEVRIADNGPGIPDHVKEKIFEPFFTTKPTGEGTGLGLSISYDIITQIHNGSLSVENNPKGGALFIITLPISPNGSLR